MSRRASNGQIAQRQFHFAVAFCLVGTAALLTGCSNEPWLRDDYVGRSWLEPGRYIQPIERDANGNAVIEKNNDE